MKECKKSSTGKHEWVYPRQEESLDKSRLVAKPYCKFCFKQEETKLDPYGMHDNGCGKSH
ncbi:MAG: hypothetical protein V4439_02925 [Patescibacteria group bacterium]